MISRGRRPAKSNNFRKCFRLVQFLPFENMSDFVPEEKGDGGQFSTKSVTDLHLIMALVEVNEASRNVSSFRA